MGLLLTAFVAGCGSGGDGGGGATAQPGTLSVSMTDAPACGYEQVNVTVSKVRVHQSDSADDNAAGWTDITVDPPLVKSICLTSTIQHKLQFRPRNLGETPLGAGHYTQLRLVLVRNNGISHCQLVVLANTNRCGCRSIRPVQYRAALN